MSETRKQAILRLYEQGERIAVIAERFGVLPAAISQAAKRAGLPRRANGPPARTRRDDGIARHTGLVKWTPERIEILRRLAAEGLTAAEIAKRSPIPSTLHNMHQLLRRFGISFNRLDHARWPEERVARLKRLHEAGASSFEIARELRLHPQTVRDKLNGLGLMVHDRPVAELRAPALHYRDTTARVLGDPPIGRSALDKRGSA